MDITRMEALKRRADELLGYHHMIVFDMLIKDDPKEAKHFLDEVWYWEYGPGEPDRDHFGK